MRMPRSLQRFAPVLLAAGLLLPLACNQGDGASVVLENAAANGDKVLDDVFAKYLESHRRNFDKIQLTVRPQSLEGKVELGPVSKVRAAGTTDKGSQAEDLTDKLVSTAKGFHTPIASDDFFVTLTITWNGQSFACEVQASERGMHDKCAMSKDTYCKVRGTLKLKSVADWSCPGINRGEMTDEQLALVTAKEKACTELRAQYKLVASAADPVDACDCGFGSNFGTIDAGVTLAQFKTTCEAKLKEFNDNVAPNATTCRSKEGSAVTEDGASCQCNGKTVPLAKYGASAFLTACGFGTGIATEKDFADACTALAGRVSNVRLNDAKNGCMCGNKNLLFTNATEPPATWSANCEKEASQAN